MSGVRWQCAHPSRPPASARIDARTNESSGGPKPLRTVMAAAFVTRGGHPSAATHLPEISGRGPRPGGFGFPRGGPPGPGGEVVLWDPQAAYDDQSTGTLAGPRTGASHASSDRPEPPAWLEETRANVGGPGRYLAFEQDGRITVIAVSREWTRIGRSLAADVRFDDATVSRRHALIANEEGGVRVLDDRSLNGIQVNGRRVEWSPLTDGDEITIGRHTLYFLDTVMAPRATEPATLSE